MKYALRRPARVLTLLLLAGLGSCESRPAATPSDDLAPETLLLSSPDQQRLDYRLQATEERLDRDISDSVTVTVRDLTTGRFIHRREARESLPILSPDVELAQATETMEELDYADSIVFSAGAPTAQISVADESAADLLRKLPARFPRWLLLAFGFITGLVVFGLVRLFLQAGPTRPTGPVLPAAPAPAPDLDSLLRALRQLDRSQTELAAIRRAQRFVSTPEHRAEMWHDREKNWKMRARNVLEIFSHLRPIVYADLRQTVLLLSPTYQDSVFRWRFAQDRSEDACRAAQRICGPEPLPETPPGLDGLTDAFVASPVSPVAVSPLVEAEEIEVTVKNMVGSAVEAGLATGLNYCLTSGTTAGKVWALVWGEPGDNEPKVAGEQSADDEASWLGSAPEAQLDGFVTTQPGLPAGFDFEDEDQFWVPSNQEFDVD